MATGVPVSVTISKVELGQTGIEVSLLGIRTGTDGWSGNCKQTLGCCDGKGLRTC